jgi:hypothetical protein
MEKFDLDIDKYDFKDLLSLFDLSDSVITENDLKKSKNIVLKMHPDKSNLSSDYFIFYKKAFEMLIEIYNKQARITQKITDENTKYKDIKENDIDKQIKKELEKIQVKDFNSKFNKLFENTMMTEKSPEINKWFTNDKSSYETNPTTNINEGIKHAKKKQSLNNVVKYRGFQTIQSSFGTDLYTDSSSEAGSYSSNTNLRFEDIRRVHRDESVFTINEFDFNETNSITIDDIKNRRDNQDLTPMTKEEAEKILKIEEKIFFDDISNKEFISKQETIKYEEKNKSILSHFLRLTHIVKDVVR